MKVCSSAGRECYRIAAVFTPVSTLYLKTGIIEGTHLKVHLGQAWRIEFSYRNIVVVWEPS